MKIVVMSDSHWYNMYFQEVVSDNQDADLIIHCGDYDPQIKIPSGVVAVKGNNDFNSDLPDEKTLTFAGLKILVTHGHQYYSSRRAQMLAEKGKKLGCQLVCFGHTHVPFAEKIDDVWVVNPGSLYQNRDGSNIGYTIITVEEGAIKSIKRQPLR